MVWLINMVLSLKAHLHWQAWGEHVSAYYLFLLEVGDVLGGPRICYNSDRIGLKLLRNNMGGTIRSHFFTSHFHKVCSDNPEYLAGNDTTSESRHVANGRGVRCVLWTVMAFGSQRSVSFDS